MPQLFTYPADLVKVIDAETLILSVDLGFGVTLKKQVVKLLDVQAPDRQTYAGRLAKSWLVKTFQVYGNTCYIVSHKPMSKGGKWLADIFTENLHVNKAIIVSGHAKPYE